MNAEEIIKFQEHLENQDASFRSLWQETAEYIFPREQYITRFVSPGERQMDRLYDVTSVIESDRMTSGLLTNLVPSGQKFFSLTTSEITLQEVDAVKSYMARATEVLHEELFTSNFLLQIPETLRSLISFGTGNMFSEWREGLNFTDWDVSHYQIMEDFRGRVDTMVLKFPRTAKQAFEEWGSESGQSIVEAMNDIKKHDEVFWFIHLTRPRKNWNPRFENSLNWPFESVYVNVKDKIIVAESGYPEFPYAVPRWAKTSGEAHGRGIGTMILPQVKVLNSQVRDFIEVGNKYANPHREVLSTFEGEYDTTPGARNDVTEIPSSYVDPNNFGNFPVTKEMVEMQRMIIKDAFYANAFAPLMELKGDRRTTLEIQERVQEAFRRIGSPIGRLESELFTPLITRCYMLLVRNGVIPEPPEELQGRNLKVVYKGPLSLAQQNAEVRASQQWMMTVGEATQFMGPAILDNIDEDDMVRRWARVFGCNEEDIASEEQVERKRATRQADVNRQKMLEAAQIQAQSYGQTVKAPEKGSAAEMR